MTDVLELRVKMALATLLKNVPHEARKLDTISHKIIIGYRRPGFCKIEIEATRTAREAFAKPKCE